jgi:osmotically-inducible protein OsmY
MMNKIKLSLVLATLITALPILQGCVPVVIGAGAAAGVMTAHDRRSTGVQTDDETIEWKALQRIPEQYKAGSHLNFTAYNARLLITGEAFTAEAKSAIGEAMSKIEGVKRVENDIAVAPASPLGNRSNDGYITSKLKARLVDTKEVSANHIKVVTENTVAYLMGIVTDHEAKVAVQIARTTDGVRKVVNLMEVLPDADVRRIDNTTLGGAKSTPASPAPVESR